MTTLAQKLATPAQTTTQIIHEAVQIELLLQRFQEQQKNDGRSEETVRSRLQSLKQVSKLCDLNNPEEIKSWLSADPKRWPENLLCKWNNKTKTKFVDTCSAYFKFVQITWNPPHYQVVQKLPFIPTEEEIDLLIAGCGKLLATILQMLKETGMRIGELTQLNAIDIDTERKTVNITPEKGSNPRVLPISDKLIAMIKNLPRDPRAKYTTLFQNHKDTLRDYLDSQRKKIAQKLNNPRIAKITFHTLRHWKGTMEYHNFGDLRDVQKILGHKSITSTVIYENTACALWLQTSENDKFICKIAHNEAEEAQLIETGFTHINNRGEAAFYKKRK